MNDAQRIEQLLAENARLTGQLAAGLNLEPKLQCWLSKEEELGASWRIDLSWRCSLTPDLASKILANSEGFISACEDLVEKSATPVPDISVENIKAGVFDFSTNKRKVAVLEYLTEVNKLHARKAKAEAKAEATEATAPSRDSDPER